MLNIAIVDDEHNEVQALKHYIEWCCGTHGIEYNASCFNSPI